jgi:hypothetical protein
MTDTDISHAVPATVRPLPPGRLGGMTRNERWGYGVWLFVGAVIGVSEIWAAVGNPRWPTISATVGHLEQLWNPVRIIVIALIVFGAVQVLTYPPRRSQFTPKQRPPRWRTHNGRLTRKGRPAAEFRHAVLYVPLALIAVVAGSIGAAELSSSKFVLGCVLYGLIAIALLIIPNALAFWAAKEVPFPTLVRTLDDLENRWHLAVMVILAGLVILAVHLVAYPWP